MLATLYSFIIPLTNPSQPPGGDKINQVLSWLMWIGMTICTMGVIIAGAMMAIGQRRGEGGEHAARLGWVLAGCIVIGVSTGLVQALLL